MNVAFFFCFSAAQESNAVQIQFDNGIDPFIEKLFTLIHT